MKTVLLLLITFITAHLSAADPAPAHTFKGEVAGVMCSACSNHVKFALGKIPGVLSVKVLHGDNAGAPAKLVVVTTSTSLTKEEANKALGGDQRTYNVTQLQPAQP